jgi:hypothetical protein
MKTVALLFFLSVAAFAQNPAPAPVVCTEQANISINGVGSFTIINSQGQNIHICNLVWSASVQTEIDFIAINGAQSTTLHGNINILTYSWNWNGDLTTKPGGLGSNFGFSVGATAVIKGSVSYYLSQN